MAKILIIDDDPVYSDMAKQRLEKAGHQVAVHIGPFGATAAASDPTLDLIILDVFMPALPGPDLLEIMRRANTQSHAATLFASSMDPGPLGQLAREHATDGHVSKAASREEFLSVIYTQALHRHQRQ